MYCVSMQCIITLYLQMLVVFQERRVLGAEVVYLSIVKPMLCLIFTLYVYIVDRDP
jgi:hypothetical protein